MFNANCYIFVDPAVRASIADSLFWFSRQAAQASQLGIFFNFLSLFWPLKAIET